MSIRSAIASVFGRKKASPWADLHAVTETPMTEGPRSDIRAAANDGPDYLLATTMRGAGPPPLSRKPNGPTALR